MIDNYEPFEIYKERCLTLSGFIEEQTAKPLGEFLYLFFKKKTSRQILIFVVSDLAYNMYISWFKSTGFKPELSEEIHRRELLALEAEGVFLERTSWTHFEADWITGSRKNIEILQKYLSERTEFCYLFKEHEECFKEFREKDFCGGVLYDHLMLKLVGD